MVFKLRDEVFMVPLFTHLLSSYIRFSDCILHCFKLRYEVFISSDTFFMRLICEGHASPLPGQ
jgi:hypothetical protein